MFDYIFKNGLIADGTGAELYAGDVAVKDGKIAEVGTLSDSACAQVFDCTGLVVAPGFIDAHSHGDISFLQDDRCEAKIFQGITTEVTGNCGESPFPCISERASHISAENLPLKNYESFSDFLKNTAESGRKMAVNQAILDGHGSLRDGVLGSADRKVSPEELRTMCELLERDMQAGAWGLSLGLEYSPGFFGDIDEFAPLGAVVKKYDGIITCHMRSEGLEIEKAIDELIEINKRTGVHVHISHLKNDCKARHGIAADIWKKICDARSAGIDIDCDMYPYTASATTFVIRCPQWALDGGDAAVLDVLAGPRRDEVIEHIRRRYPDGAEAEKALITDTHGFWTEVEGLTLRQLADDILHMDYAEALAELIIRTKAKADGAFFVMDEKDVDYNLHREEIMIGTDGRGFSYERSEINGIPHPRVYGALPEFLGIARDRGICSTADAVKRITSLPAACFGIKDRGLLKPGMAADITVFNAETVTGGATYLNPFTKPTGIVHVMVNGEPAIIDGTQTENRTGLFLKKR